MGMIDFCTRILWLFSWKVLKDYHRVVYLVRLMCFSDFVFFLFLKESHVDRGDTQRAIAIFRDISVSIMLLGK